MKVVVFAPSGAVASALDQLPLGDGDDVLVVAGGPPDTVAGVRTVILTPSLRAATRWAGAALGGSVASGGYWPQSSGSVPIYASLTWVRWDSAGTRICPGSQCVQSSRRACRNFPAA